MRNRRLLLVLAALVALAATAANAHADLAAPTGLHGFLLRADEPARTSFPRTPSFAWNPVPGAIHYEFQLSLSTAFRDNSVVYADLDALTPVEAPPITLPWITGTPHALYARVRAITPDGATPWSANFGFDMAPANPPTPLAGYPGLLRWTPVEGASGYQVWLIDAHKVEYSNTNSLDEREFYTFHQTTSWIGQVRWRIRALRDDLTSSGAGRLNGIPAVEYGPWSSIYTSTNPAMTSGAIKLVGTVSDVFSNGSPASPAHRIMPGFLWTGSQTLSGTPVELYRVYIFTDKQCLNTVYTSAIIGSPAYAPRPGGPLALPATATAEATARSQYLTDGPEPSTYTYDGDTVKSTESAGAATPTTSVPGEPGSGTTTTTPSTPSSTSSSSTTTSSSTGLTVTGEIGAPTDLWDTNWPSSGYYWTVVGVVAGSPGAISTSVGPGGSKTGDLTLPLTSTTGFDPGDVIQIGTGSTSESATITVVSTSSVTVAVALKFGHSFGETVTRTSGGFQYEDAELPQDVCAAGRVMRFGKESEPSLVASGQLFASGLSSDGRLASALRTTSFYGQPLVSWTPALGAEVYEVQWSKTQYPFNAELDPANGQPGKMTFSNSIVLPVGPGTWWYRVRGFDYSLPTGAQQMSWSDPAKLVVAAPKFKIVGGSTAAPSAKSKVKASAGATTKYNLGTFSLSVPSSWTQTSTAGSLFAAKSATTGAAVAKESARGSRTLAAWAQALVVYAESMGATGVKSNVVHEPGGTAIHLSFLASGGKLWIEEYDFDAGSVSYRLLVDGPPSAAAANRAVAARIAASFRHT